MLVLVDYAMRYLEAVPVCNISARNLAETLFCVMSKVRITKEILTDKGMSFMSQTLYELLGINLIHTSVHHPQTDGLVQRFNQTLKNIIQLREEFG